MQRHAGLAELSREEAARQRSTPLVRRLAAQRGVRLGDVPGTGFAGRVRREDLLTYLEHPRNAVSLSVVGQPSPTVLADSIPAARQGQSAVPTGGSRVPTATTIIAIDLTSIVRRVQRGATSSRHRPTVQRDYLPYLVKAAVDSLPSHRLVNAVFRPDGIFVYRDVHLAVMSLVASGNRGEPSAQVHLIRHAQRLSVEQIAGALAEGGDPGSDATSVPDAAACSTFRVESCDGAGPTLSTSDLVGPHAAVLSFGAMAKRAVVRTDANDNDSIAIRWMTDASFTFDHRVIDGLTACRFLASMKERVERTSGS